MFLHLASDTLAGDGLKVVHWGEIHIAIRGAAHDGLGQGMLAGPLQLAASAACPAPESHRGETIETSFGFPSVNVPVLSMTRVSTLRQHFQRLGVLEQHADHRAFTCGHHDGHGCGQAQRARQAMINTATALITACARRGSGPQMPQAAS